MSFCTQPLEISGKIFRVLSYSSLDLQTGGGYDHFQFYSHFGEKNKFSHRT